MKPLVSIIVPVYKVEPYLPRCLDSIIHQTYRQLEIIVVDDGSPDNCGHICDEYANIDSRIKVYHTENHGLSAARNYALARANGEYIGFVDSDDWIEPDMYKVLVGEIEKCKADIVSCGVYYESSKRTVIGSALDKKCDNNLDLLKILLTGNISNGVWNKLYKKSCFTGIAFPEGHVYEEIATIYKIFANVSTATFIPQPFYHYLQHRNGSITTTHSVENLRDYWLAHKMRYDFFISVKQFNNDKTLTNKLLIYCARAISRAIRHYYQLTEEEKNYLHPFIEEMRTFAALHLPAFGMKDWPYYLRFSVFMAKFDNVAVYALLYYMSRIYKRLFIATIRMCYNIYNSYF